MLVLPEGIPFLTIGEIPQLIRSPRQMDAERVMPVSIVTSALRVKSNSAAIDPWDAFFFFNRSRNLLQEVLPSPN